MKILIAEIDALSRAVLSKSLEGLGAEVKAVANGASALLTLQKPDAPPIAILSAILPGISGLDVIKQLREKLGANCPYLVLLSTTPAPESSADFFIPKPLGEAQLAGLLKEALAKAEARSGVPAAAEAALVAEADAPVIEATSVSDNPLFGALRELKPFTENAKMLETALLGLGVSSIHMETPKNRLEPTPGELSVWSVIILPEKEIWFDLLIQADRKSASKLVETVLGTTDAGESDLEDFLREILNLLQGTFKTAFQRAGMEVITPVIPKPVGSDKVPSWCRALQFPLHYRFTTDDILLKMTLFPYLAAPAQKPSELLSISNVLTQAVSLPGDANVILFNKGTMLTKRYLEKLRNIAEMETKTLTYEAVAASVLTEILM